MDDHRQSDESLARDLLHSVRRFTRAFQLEAFRALPAEQKPAQVFLLFMLAREEKAGAPGLRVSELASRLEVTASSVTQLVTELEEKGLVERRIDAQDRRAVLVSSTPAGMELVARVRAPLLEGMGRLVDGLGAERAATFLALLEEARGIMDKENQGRC